MDGTFIDVVINKLQWLLNHPEVTWSGSGIYALSLTGSAVLAVASWCFWRKKKSPATNEFNCNSGEQNSPSTADNQSPAIGAGRDVAVNYYGNGLSTKDFADYAGKLAVTESALTSFFKILEEQQVPLHDLDSKLREIAAQRKELLARLESVQSADPQVRVLKEQAEKAIERGDYAKAEVLLEDVANQHSIAAAEANAAQARLQRILYRYAKAAEYWQKAAALLPKDKKKERAYYLNAAGDDLNSMFRYKEAMVLYEQSLRIRQEIGDRAGEGTTLNNIGEIYRRWGNHATGWRWGDHATAWRLLDQSLSISRELGDKSQEGTTLNNIGEIYRAQGDYTAALKYLEHSLRITQEIGDKKQEGATLNNISLIYSARGDYTTALKHLEQALAIQQEIGDRRGEAETNWNTGRAYEDQGDLRKAEAEEYMSRAVQLAEEIDHPKLKEWRKALEQFRANGESPY